MAKAREKLVRATGKGYKQGGWRISTGGRWKAGG